jgi:hypothetical protein
VTASLLPLAPGNAVVKALCAYPRLAPTSQLSDSRRSPPAASP